MLEGIDVIRILMPLPSMQSTPSRMLVYGACRVPLRTSFAAEQISSAEMSLPSEFRRGNRGMILISPVSRSIVTSEKTRVNPSRIDARECAANACSLAT